MGIIKDEDVIAWRVDGKFFCAGCGDPGEAEPLTKEDFEEDDMVTCDNCHRERIL